MHKSGSAVSKERCSAKGSFSTAARHSEAATAAGSTAKNLVGPAHATLSSSDDGAAHSVHRHGSISSAKHCRITDRHQGVAVEHEGSYLLPFELTDLLVVNFAAIINLSHRYFVLMMNL